MFGIYKVKKVHSSLSRTKENFKLEDRTLQHLKNTSNRIRKILYYRRLSYQ